jgi:hypothetical protein
VTWQLDIPPANLLHPVKKDAAASEVPSLRELRKTLMRTRFETLKVSTFAVFLVAIVALAIHGSHIVSSENQFGANAEVAFQTLATTASTRTASVRGQTEAFALAIVHGTKPVQRPVTAGIAPAQSRLTHPKADTRAAQRIAQHVRISPELGSKPIARGTTSPVAQPPTSRLHDAASMLKSFLTPDAITAAIVSLLLYILFVVILIRRNGGLRAFSRRQAA